MVYYLDDADCTLRIAGARFTAKCTKSSVGTNNIAKSSSWSGHVVTKDNHVILKDQGGTMLDPLVGATIEMDFEHVPSTGA